MQGGLSAEMLLPSTVITALRGAGVSSVCEPLMVAGRLGLIDLTAVAATLSRAGGAAPSVSHVGEARRQLRLDLRPKAMFLPWCDDGALGGSLLIDHDHRLVFMERTANLVTDWRTPVSFSSDLPGCPLDSYFESRITKGNGYLIGEHSGTDVKSYTSFQVPLLRL
jgi:hypothetical protein